MERLKRFLAPSTPAWLFFAAEAGLTAYVCRKTLVFDGLVFVGFPFGFWPVGDPNGWMIGPGRAMPGPAWGALALDAAFWWAAACGFAALWRLRPSGRRDSL